MYASILHHIDTPPLGIGCVYTMLIDGSLLLANVYDVTIECCPGCTCIDFVSLLSSSIRKKGKYVSCKLLHFIFTKKMFCDLKVDIFIHQPTLSWNEVYCFLQKDNLWIFISIWWAFFTKTMSLETISIYIKCY